jgi:putative hydrolase of the HAD superfamily
MTDRDRTIKVILLDLDNTLYPPEVGLIEAGDKFIADFIARRLGLPWDEADALRIRTWIEYGATARGLEIEHGIPQREYFAGSIERVPVADYISPDPALAEMLAALPQRRYVFTNATEVYAARVLDALGVAELFEAVFHIEFCGGSPKPEVSAYQAVLDAIGVDATRVALVDDTEANLEPAADLGILTMKLGEPPADARHLHLTSLGELAGALGN